MGKREQVSFRTGGKLVKGYVERYEPGRFGTFELKVLRNIQMAKEGFVDPLRASFRNAGRIVVVSGEPRSVVGFHAENGQIYRLSLDVDSLANLIGSVQQMLGIFYASLVQSDRSSGTRKRLGTTPKGKGQRSSRSVSKASSGVSNGPSKQSSPRKMTKRPSIRGRIAKAPARARKTQPAMTKH